MTVGELKRALAQLSDDMEAIVQYDLDVFAITLIENIGDSNYDDQLVIYVDCYGAAHGTAKTGV